MKFGALGKAGWQKYEEVTFSGVQSTSAGSLSGSAASKSRIIRMKSGSIGFYLL
jgi:hypothetical protein